MSDPLQWRQKYLDVLERHEQDEQRWHGTEALLKRLVSRLCIAARGLSPDFDRVIDELLTRIKGPFDAESVQPLLQRLAVVISDLDHQNFGPAESSEEPSADHADSMIGHLLIELLNQLEVAPESRSELIELRDQVPLAKKIEQQSLLISRTVTLVNAQRIGMVREKKDLERIVEQVTRQLDEVAMWLVGQTENEAEAKSNGEQLTGDLHQEVSALNFSMGEAKSMEEVRRRVRERLQMVGEHLSSFRHREEKRLKTFKQRTEAMDERIKELESQALRLKESVRREQQLAITDVLTGLPNRLAYRDRIEGDFKRWREHGIPACIAVWDIDHFKSINDTLGHKAGDTAIRCIAQQLMKSCRKSDMVARYGGEEFVMILDGLEGAEALQCAEKIRTAIENVDFRHSGKPVRITASCGISEVRLQDTPDTAFERADRALYEAKGAGRNCCIQV